ncbi:MAG TPA: bifunctional folylpolyglutamate synthase/dihydrofolate synthase [Elusimicrobia bacterium]|nr:bifunctional folylpolyglutamate synthase/dihydrofolate synthase [Elusimicrobiota bacterium]HBT60689.1 bifunctional folylpolyglutamate synthase/dihydrofolate synthase [Elusimicrobiota bacterium]
MTYREALRVLAERQECRIRLGLSRLRGALRRLGDPHKTLPCIHVAGTNGKGSTCAILESVLRACGYRTGLYLSPHLMSVRERIQVRGRPVSRAEFSRLLGRTLAADVRRELTYFELLTCVAFLYFREKNSDAVVLETGLGGRLDATNVIQRPLASVITSLDFDHAQWLGRTLPRIAAEKAGIIKPGCPVFVPALAPSAMRVVAARARARGAALHVSRRPWRTAATRWRANTQILDSGRGRYELSLLGFPQGRNAALAAMVLGRLQEVLPVAERAWLEGLRRVRLPGRFEVVVRDGRIVILDGAHNREAMAALARTLDASPWGRRRLLWIMGMMRDKDCGKIVSQVAPRLQEVVAVAPPCPRALPAAALAREIRRQAPAAVVREAPDAAAALRAWQNDPASPRVAVVCGSFYLAGAALRGGVHG